MTAASMAHITEITMVGGERHRVEGDADSIERAIIDASRGSIMQLAWLETADAAGRIGINPDCVVLLRALS